MCKDKGLSVSGNKTALAKRMSKATSDAAREKAPSASASNQKNPAKDDSSSSTSGSDDGQSSSEEEDEMDPKRLFETPKTSAAAPVAVGKKTVFDKTNSSTPTFVAGIPPTPYVDANGDVTKRKYSVATAEDRNKAGASSSSADALGPWAKGKPMKISELVVRDTFFYRELVLGPNNTPALTDWTMGSVKTILDAHILFFDNKSKAKSILSEDVYLTKRNGKAVVNSSVSVKQTTAASAPASKATKIIDPPNGAAASTAAAKPVHKKRLAVANAITQVQELSAAEASKKKPKV